MYWPDYNVRPRRKPRWGCLLLGLLIGLIGTILVNGWWRGLLPPADGEPPPASLVATPSPPPGSGEEVQAVTGSAPVALNETAPDFALPDLFDEQTMHVMAEYRGRPVILNFWASWCVPCRREMPALQESAAGHEAEDVLLLGMNQTYLDDLDAARAFVQELGLTFPNTRDDGGAVGSGAYAVVGLPTTVFITRDGRVAHIQIGEMSLEQITVLTERLVDGELSRP